MKLQVMGLDYLHYHFRLTGLPHDHWAEKTQSADIREGTEFSCSLDGHGLDVDVDGFWRCSTAGGWG